MTEKDYKTAISILGRDPEPETMKRKEILIECLEVVALGVALYLAYWCLP